MSSDWSVLRMCMFCQFSLPLPSSHLIRKCSLCTRYYFVKRLSVVWSNPSVFLLLESFAKKNMVCNDLILPFFISVFFHSVVWHALTGAYSGALIKLRPQNPPPYSWTSLWLRFSSYRLAQLVRAVHIESISIGGSVGEPNQTWNFYIQTDWVVPNGYFWNNNSSDKS